MEDFGNDLCFSGRVATFNSMDYDDRYFGGAMTIIGSSVRKGSDFVKECQLGFLVPKSVWDNLNKKGISVGSNIEVAGHFETWTKTKETWIDGQRVLRDKFKTIHVIDQVINL